MTWVLIIYALNSQGGTWSELNRAHGFKDAGACALAGDDARNANPSTRMWTLCVPDGVAEKTPTPSKTKETK